MQNNMQIWLESSTTTFNLNSHEDGVYLISDLDGLTSLPSIRTSAGVNAGTDGGWTSAQAFDARLISVRVVITNEDVSVVETKRRQLNSLLAQSRKETLKLHFLSEGGMEYVINVRITNVTGALTNILKKQELLIQMRADDPIIYGSQGGGSADATLNVQQAIGGFEIPFDIPLIIDGGTDKVNVENLGSEEVYPTIKMTGPLHNPTVVNETQDAEIGVNADLGGEEPQGYESLQLLGNATQKTTTGKNLFGASQGSRTDNAITSTIKDGVITLNGTTSGSGTIGIGNQEIHYTPEGGDTYTFTIWLLSGTATFDLPDDCGFYIRKPDGTSYATGASLVMSRIRQYGYQTTTFKAPSATPMRFLISANKAGIAFNNVVLRVQIEKGSTKTDWEEYTAGVSPNPSYPQAVQTVAGEQTVKITGKNFFDFDRFISENVSNPIVGIQRGTATWTSDSITITATANDAYTKYSFSPEVYPIIKVRKNTDYTLSWKSSNTSETIRGLVYIFGKNTSGGANIITNVRDYTNGATFNTGNYTEIAFRLGVNTAGDSLTYSDIMLEEGGQKTSYEPYQGQTYEINLGKNLLDASALVTTGITLADGVLSGTAGAFSTAYGVSIGVPITTTATQLAVSLKAYTDAETPSTNNGLKIRAIYKDGSGADIIPFTNDTTTATYKSAITSNTKEIDKIAITFGNYPNNTWHISDFQIEASPVPTPYAPYKTPIELAKIGTYQDYIWNDNGTWKIHKATGKVVFDGSEEWYIASNGNSFHHTTVDAARMPDRDTISYVMSNYYTAETYNRVTAATPVIDYGMALSNTANRIVIRNKDIATASDFRTWLSTHNTTVYYALATPTDTEITDQSLIDALNSFVNSAPWYGEDQNIFLIPSGGAQGTLIIGDHIPPKPADEVLIDTQLKTVTLNGQNIYHLLKEGSSFFTLAPGDNSMYLTSDVSSDTGKAEIKFKQGFVSI